MKKIKWKDAIYNGNIIEDWEVSEYGVLRNKTTGKEKYGYDNVKGKDMHQRVSIKHKNYYIHKIVAESFIPNPNNFPVVRHKDDDPTNNYYKNLEWGTHKDNTLDAIRNGKIKYDENRKYTRNEDHPQAILKNKDIKKIINLLLDSTPITEIAKKFNVDRDVILHIYKGNSWKALTKDYLPFPEQHVYNPISEKSKKNIKKYLKKHPNAKPSEIINKFNLEFDNRTKGYIQYQKRKLRNKK